MKALVCFVVCVCALFGQGDRGAFNGTVTDSSGAPVPEAAVVITDTQTGVETRATTNASGVYQAPYLIPGTYRLTVTKTGFRSSVAQNVTLRVAQTLTLDFQLEIGQVSEAINVTAEAPQIETGTSEIGRYVSEKEFDTWPLAVGDGRRQIQSFIFRSLPGTTGGEFKGAINGGQAYSHEILIDGMALGRFDLNGGSNNEFSPSSEAVNEFKLQTGTMGAQYGGGQTAVANFAVKSGTNDFHGSAYTYLQNDVLRANSFNNNAISRARNPYKLLNYGASVGGPILIPKLYNGKNKTFFFFSAEVTRQRDFSPGGFITLPTLDFKQGDFSRLLNAAGTGNASSGTNVGTDALGRPVVFGQIFDPATTRTVNGQTVRDPFPGNIIPQNRWSTVSRNVLQQAPITDPINSSLLNNMLSLGACCPVFDEKMYAGKFNHAFNEAHRIGFYMSHNDRVRNNSPAGRWGAPPNTPTGVYQLQSTPGWMVRFSEDWTISPTVLNHFAIGYNRFGNINESVYVDQDWASKIGLQNTAPTTFPAIRFIGAPILGGQIGAPSGTTGRLGSESRGLSYNGSTIIQDDLTIVKGKHNLKAGFEFRMYYVNNRGKSGTGQFDFSSQQTQQPGFNSQTGNAFASFLLGEVSAATRAVNLTNPGYRVRYPAFYFSDDWKVTRKLTINAGLRWEIVGPLYEVAGRMTNVDPSKPNPSANGVPGALIFADELGVNTFQTRNWKQLSPRFGFAYAFTDKFVLRGGYGMNNLAPVTNFSSPSAFGYNGAIAVNSSNTPIPFAESAVMNWDNPYPNSTTPLPNRNPSGANGQDITYIAPDSNRLGMMQNFNLGIQWEIPKSGTVLEVSYIGNRGQRLVSRGLDALNQLPVSVLTQYGDALRNPYSPSSGVSLPYPGFTGTLAQALRRFPQYLGVSQFLPNFGRSSYDSVQVMANRRLNHGLQILAAYTFSKNLSDTYNPLDGIAAQDVYNRRIEKSLTDINYPHVFKLTWIYELPFGAGREFKLNKVADAVLGGWTITGVHQYRTGDPILVTVSGFQNVLFNGGYRPDRVAGAEAVIDTGAPVQTSGGTPYLNPAAFTTLPATAGGVPLRIGNSPRVLPNAFGPQFSSEDFGLSKTFTFAERYRFEIRGDAFNAFNRAGRGGLNTDFNSPLFGRLTGQQYGPRSIQVAGRFEF